MQANGEEPMVDVATSPGDVVDIWPYVASVARTVSLPDLVLEKGLVDHVYRSGDAFMITSYFRLKRRIGLLLSLQIAPNSRSPDITFTILISYTESNRSRTRRQSQRPRAAVADL